MDTKKGDTYYRLRFSEILSKEKLLSNVDLFKIMQAQREGNMESLGQIAVKKGILSEGQLAEVYKKYFNIAQVTLNNRKISEEVAYLIPVVLLRKYLVFPLQFTSSKKLAIAMVNPLDIQAVKHLEVLTHYPIKPLYCAESEILKKVEQFFEKNTQSGVEVLQEDRLVALNPKEALSFFKSQKQKNPEPVEKKEPPPLVSVSNEEAEEAEEIIEVKPISKASPYPLQRGTSSVKVNTSPGATTFWGDASGKPKLEPVGTPNPVPVEATIPQKSLKMTPPPPPTPLSVKPLKLDPTAKMKVVNMDQPLQNKVDPQSKGVPPLDLRQTPVSTSTKKLKSMGKEPEKKPEEPTLSRTYKLKPMQVGSSTESSVVKELKSSQKKLEETNSLSKEATQKLAELTEQLQEELEPKKNAMLNASPRKTMLRRKLRSVERPHLFAPVPIPVLPMSAIDFYKKSEAMPKTFLEEKIHGWLDPQALIPAEALTTEEFYLLEG